MDWFTKEMFWFLMNKFVSGGDKCGSQDCSKCPFCELIDKLDADGKLSDGHRYDGPDSGFDCYRVLGDIISGEIKIGDECNG